MNEVGAALYARLTNMGANCSGTSNTLLISIQHKTNAPDFLLLYQLLKNSRKDAKEKTWRLCAFARDKPSGGGI